MNDRIKTTRRLLLGAAAALPLARPALAQNIAGGRTMRIVVPFGAGGTVDLAARLVAREFTERLGQTVVVENRTGGGANIAMEHVARATPDGTTLLMASPSVVANPFLYSSLTYDPATQLAPIGLVAEVPTMLLAPPNFEANDARSFIEMAKARPDHFTYASGGSGTTEHLAAEMLKARVGIDLLHVPYRGGAPALTDLMAGRVSVMFTNLGAALSTLQDGRIKGLGIAAPERSPAMPNVATFAEQGVPDFNISVWWAVMGPAGMPPEVVQRLNAVLAEAVASPGMREGIARLSATPLGGSVERFAAHLRQQSESWGAVIRGANIRAD